MSRMYIFRNTSKPSMCHGFIPLADGRWEAHCFSTQDGGYDDVNSSSAVLASWNRDTKTSTEVGRIRIDDFDFNEVSYLSLLELLETLEADVKIQLQFLGAAQEEDDV